MQATARLRWTATLTLALAITCAPFAAADAPQGLSASGAWVRWLPNELPAAAYMTVFNSSEGDAFLTGASSKDYAMVHLHESYTTPGGGSGMRPVAKLRVPSHGDARLAPGGFHLMLMTPRRSIEPGDTVTLVLKFEGGAELSVKVPVKPADYQP